MKPIIFLILLHLTNVAQADLDQKLEKHFERLDEAQKAIKSSVVNNSRFWSRSSLETFLDVEFSETELLQLREKQKSQIYKAQIEAEEHSLIKINVFRDDTEKVKAFCKALPKGAMLHVHPDGTMDRSTVKELLEQGNPQVNGPYLKKAAVDEAGFFLYPEEIVFLNSLVPSRRYSMLTSFEQESLQELFFLPQEPYSHEFSRFMAFFFIKGIVHRREDGDRNASADKVYRDFFKRAKEQKVIYVEFTASVQPKKWALEQLTRWAEIGKEYGVTSRWNISFYRNNDPHKNEAEMKEWIAFLRAQEVYPELISGIDMLADESTHPALEQGQGVYLQALSAAQPEGEEKPIPLHRTMHAGELGHIHNVRDAMILGVNRVGHGVKLWLDPLTLEYAIKKKLPIETNLISNIRLQVIDDLVSHPFLNFLRLGLPLSFSTDDEGLFETTMNTECESAISHSDIQYSELKQISYNGIRTAFISEKSKETLLQILDKQFSEFEQTQDRF